MNQGHTEPNNLNTFETKLAYKEILKAKKMSWSIFLNISRAVSIFKAVKGQCVPLADSIREHQAELKTAVAP